MWEGRRVSVVLPAYNEVASVAEAARAFRATGLVDEVLVVDNNSTDETAGAARAGGARVVAESRQGLGWAVRRGLAESAGEVVVLCEPDGTFEANDLRRLLAYADQFDVVQGTRTSNTLIWSGANMGVFLKWGNWAVAKLLEFLFNGPSLTDVGCTFRLIHRRIVDRALPRLSVGASHILPDLTIACLRSGARMVEIPVNYRPRLGESKITGSLGRAVAVGLRMIGLILRRRLQRSGA